MSMNNRSGGPSQAAPTERELIRRAKKGDGEAFCRLMETYSGAIFNVGYKMLGNREDANDMSQETMIKIYRNLERFRGDSAFSTWVYRITVNSCRDYLRSAYRRRECVFSGFGEDEEERPEFEVADYSWQPEQLCIAGEEEKYLHALIDGLKPQFRLVVVLRELNGLSYQEIAAASDISVGTVKSRLNRARAAMREQILRDAEQYPGLLRLMGKGGSDDGMH